MKVRKKVRGALSGKLFYLLVSLVFSIALWAYVEINENTTQSYTINNVPVTRINEEVLTDRGLLVSSMSPQTVTLIFECSPSVGRRLSNTSLSAVVDMVNVTARGYTALRYEVVYPEDVGPEDAVLTTRSVERISMNIDTMATRTINIEAPYRGGVAEGYIQDAIVIDPREVTVSGPADLVSRISAARVDIIRENLSATYSEELSLTLLDENGEEFDDEQLNQLIISDESVHVTIPIRVVKEVVLTVEFNYGAGANAQNTTYSINPPTIMIAADPDAARDFNSINLTTINLMGVEKFTDTMNYPIVVPNNVDNHSGIIEAAVTYEMSGLEIRHFSVSNITPINAPAGYTAESRTQSVDVRIRGTPADMENLTVENIRVVADVSNLGAGTQQIQARVYIDGVDADIGAIGEYTITVAIVRDT